MADFSVIKEAGKLQVLLAAGNELNLIDTERHLLLRALEKTSRNQMKAAAVLGISRNRLRTETKNHGFLQEEQCEIPQSSVSTGILEVVMSVDILRKFE